MKLTLSVVRAAVVVASVLSFGASVSRAQVNLYLNDGSGHLSIISGAAGNGTFTLPNGGGTLITAGNVGGLNQVLTSNGPNMLPTWQNASGGGSGTVTSIAMTVPTFLSVSVAPITTNGTFAVSLSGTALPIANGGTGQTSANAAFNALSPMSAVGDIEYEGTGPAATRLAGSTTASTKTFLTSTATSGGVATAPAWATIAGGDVPVFVKSGSTHAAGTVPDPGATAGTTRYLREDGNWIAPSGGGNSELGGCTGLETLSPGNNPDYWDPAASSNLSGPTPNVANSDVMLVTRSGTIKNFFMALSAKTGNTSNYWIFTLMDVTTSTNGPTVNVGGTSLTANDTSTQLTVSAGDIITLVQTFHGSPSAAATATWAFELQ